MEMKSIYYSLSLYTALLLYQSIFELCHSSTVKCIGGYGCRLWGTMYHIQKERVKVLDVKFSAVAFDA